MTDERLGNNLDEPSHALDDAAGDEEALERYLVRERPIIQFVTAQAERSPWWAISLLVHLLVLIVLWKCPVRPRVETDELSTYPVGIMPPPIDPLVPDPPPPDDPDPVEVSDADLNFGDPDAGYEPDLAPPKPPLIDPLPVPPQEPVDPLWQPRILVVTTVDHSPNRLTDMFANRPVPSRGGGLRFGTPGTPDGGRLITHTLLPALRWLARAQERDGSWNAKSWDGAQPYSTGTTGLSLLAFLGAGFNHRKGEFKATISRALTWLGRSQRPDGSFPWTTFYEQGIATMAVCEAYAMTRDPRVKRVAQRAVLYICRVQPEHGGFRYHGPVPKGQGDMSVTGWQIMAIKSALCSDLVVPPQAIERSRVFLHNALRKYGTSSYIISSPAQGSLAVTAAGTFCRMLIGEKDAWDSEIRQSTTMLLAKETEDGKAIYGGGTKQLVRDLYYTYYSALAMFQAGPEYWKLWNDSYMEPLRIAMIRHKLDEQGRFVRGSWDPAKCRWGKTGGRIYATAMAVLSLEVPFRYIRIYRRPD